jgi:hypothetical protein
MLIRPSPQACRFSTTLAAQDPRRQKLIAAVLADLKRLSDES